MNCSRHTAYIDCRIVFLSKELIWLNKDRFFNQAWSVSGPQKYSTCGSLFIESKMKCFTAPNIPGIRLQVGFVHDELFQGRKNIPLADRCSKMKCFTAPHIRNFRDPGVRLHWIVPGAQNIFHFRIAFHRWIFPGVRDVFPLENCYSHVKHTTSSFWETFFNAMNCSRHTKFSTWGSLFKEGFFQARHLIPTASLFRHGEMFQTSRIFALEDRACAMNCSRRTAYSICGSLSKTMNFSRQAPQVSTWGSFFKAINCSRHATRISTWESFFTHELFQAHKIFQWAFWLSSESIRFSTRWIVPGAQNIPLHWFKNGPLGYRFSNRWIIPSAQNIPTWLSWMGHLAIVFQTDELFQAHKIF